MTYRIYCGTYGKYNAGSLDGQWFDLEDYTDKLEFLEACQVFHDRNNPVDDDGDPIPAEHEFMFQDFEGPRSMISECHVDAALWDMMEHRADEEAKNAFVDYYGEWDGDRFNECYRGEYSSDTAMAEEFLDETGGLGSIPENLRWYFDYEKFARDLLISDMFESNGHYFWRQ